MILCSVEFKACQSKHDWYGVYPNSILHPTSFICLTTWSFLHSILCIFHVIVYDYQDDFFEDLLMPVSRHCTVQFEMLSGFWYQLSSRLNIVHRWLFCGFISWLSFSVSISIDSEWIVQDSRDSVQINAQKAVMSCGNPFALIWNHCWSQWRVLNYRLLTAWKLGGLRNAVLSWSLFFNQTAIFEWCAMMCGSKNANTNKYMYLKDFGLWIWQPF